MKKEMPTMTKTKNRKNRERLQMQVILASGEAIDLFDIGGSLEKFAGHIERKGLYIRIKEKAVPAIGSAGATGVRRIPPHSITEIRWGEKRR